jgi:hypothetical protein
MSQYLHYHFVAIDRPLNAGELADLRALSTRATITPTSFENTYHYGSFKGRPDELVERYFDAYVYVDGWGSRELQLRFPKDALGADRVAPYAVDGWLEVRTKGGFTIVTLRLDDEDADEPWAFAEDAAKWLPSLLPVRAALLAGDLRALHVAWLAGVQHGLIEDEEPEPEPPPGLDDLDFALEALVEFVDLDEDFLDASARLTRPAAGARRQPSTSSQTSSIASSKPFRRARTSTTRRRAPTNASAQRPGRSARAASAACRSAAEARAISRSSAGRATAMAGPIGSPATPAFQMPATARSAAR